MIFFALKKNFLKKTDLNELLTGKGQRNQMTIY